MRDVRRREFRPTGRDWPPTLGAHGILPQRSRPRFTPRHNDRDSLDNLAVPQWPGSIAWSNRRKLHSSLVGCKRPQSPVGGPATVFNHPEQSQSGRQLRLLSSQPFLSTCSSPRPRESTLIRPSAVRTSATWFPVTTDCESGLLSSRESWLALSCTRCCDVVGDSPARGRRQSASATARRDANSRPIATSRTPILSRSKASKGCEERTRIL